MKEKDKKNGWTLVTGAAKGVGRAIALELAKRKMPVVIHYNTSKNLAEALAKECAKTAPVEIIQGNFDDVQGFVKRYTKRFPRTKNLINNVGNFLESKLLEPSYEELVGLFQSNFFAPFVLCQQLVDSIKKEQGSIVNIGSSGLQSARGFGHAPLYNISKLSLLSFTKALARDLAQDHVRVNMVSPGKLENSVDAKGMKTLPMGRFGKLDEVANVVAFLLDEKSSYITGQNIEVAGGLGL